MRNFSCGIDIGSRSIKIVIFDIENSKIKDIKVSDTTSFPQKEAEKLFQEIISENNIPEEEIKYIISTGYGREQFTKADKKLTEISCHAKGVHFLFPEAGTVIDIGGQDSKVIKLAHGNVCDFAMNDKCAAGTGRFLEVVEKIVEVPRSKMDEILEEVSSPCSISSMCVVFAESEIISLLASGNKIADILAGVLESLARRTVSLAGKIGLNPPIVFTGGVANNKAMVKTMESVIGEKLLLPPNPSITGALGAAIIAAGYKKA